MVRFFFWMVLSSLLMGSALAVVYTKYRTRLLYIDIQKQERLLDQEAIKWGQLQLEITTLTAENRIETQARNQLNLVWPNRSAIIYIKP